MANLKNKSLLLHFLNKNPDLKKSLEENLDEISPADREQQIQLMEKFIGGEVTWAEIRGISKKLLKFLAKIGYQSFKSGDFKKAEILFKGLTVIDHTNWYYRSALGAVYQKQSLLEQAIEEYTLALELNPQEITSLVNRGQCYLRLNDVDLAEEDFLAAMKLPLKADHPWLTKAKTLHQSVMAAQGDVK